MMPPVNDSTGGITVCAAAPPAPASAATVTASSTRLIRSPLTRTPPAPCRREIDEERHDDPDHRHHRPLPREPVLHRRVPEQGRGQEDEPEERPEDRGEDPAEPPGEEPQQRDREPRR